MGGRDESEARQRVGARLRVRVQPVAALLVPIAVAACASSGPPGFGDFGETGEATEGATAWEAVDDLPTGGTETSSGGNMGGADTGSADTLPDGDGTTADADDPLGDDAGDADDADGEDGSQETGDDGDLEPSTESSDGANADDDAGNLVENGDFEDGNASWGLNQGAVTGTNPRTGSLSLEYRQQDVNGEIDEVHNTVEGIVPGNDYAISAWVAGENLAGPKGVRIRYFFAADGEPVSESVLMFSMAGTYDYVEATAVETAPAGANELELVVIHYLDEGPGVSFCDDVTVEEI